MDEPRPGFISTTDSSAVFALELIWIRVWLVKAVVWRESRFESKKSKGAMESGLMQVTERRGQRVVCAKTRSPVSIRINFSNQRRIWRPAPGIIARAWNTDPSSPIQSLCSGGV